MGVDIMKIVKFRIDLKNYLRSIHINSQQHHDQPPLPSSTASSTISQPERLSTNFSIVSQREIGASDRNVATVETLEPNADRSRQTPNRS